MSEYSKLIVVEQAFEASPEAVWGAITERKQMIQWFFDNIPEFKADVGFETRFTVETGQRRFTHLWRITEVVPGRKIVYDWRYAEYSGVGTVSFEVLDEGPGTRVRVTNEGLESFPPEVPEFAPESCEGGWKYFIQGNLKNFLDQRQ